MSSIEKMIKKGIPPAFMTAMFPKTNSFGKKPSKSLKDRAKKRGIRLTRNVNGKRKPKTKSMLQNELKKKK